MLDLVLIREEDRDQLAEYVGSQSESADLPCGLSRRARSIELSWPELDGHVDDTVWNASSPETARIGIDGGVDVLGAVSEPQFS